MAKKVHIALVGGQVAPVYYGVYQCNPDQVILICSAQTTDEALRLRDLLVANHFETTIEEIDSIDLALIHQKAVSIRDALNNEDALSINLVGGTKSWSLVFYDVFSKRNNTSLLLVDQNNRIWSIPDRTCETLKKTVDIDDLLALYGNPIIKYRSISEYTPQDFTVMNQIPAIRKANRKVFKELASVLSRDFSDRYRDNTSDIFRSGGAMVEWNKPDHVIVRLWDNNLGQDREFVLHSPNATSLFFNSGWFELKVARLLSKWKEAKEIRMNCVFPLIPTDGDDVIKNEVDIIIRTNTKLLFVECKTYAYNGTDIDKFATVVKNYGGSGTKALFISEKPIPNLVKRKCQESRILCFSLDRPKEELFRLLDKELDNTNIR